MFPSHAMENFGNRFMEILALPLRDRCQELTFLIDRCSLKELQEIFPILVHSIFLSNNGIGWGLRSVVANMSSYEFNILYEFFLPLGPMFRLCYKLLNDTLKFDVPISSLPIKMRQMLESGRYPLYYGDAINVDHFNRHVNSLSFNAFDYYILHFALHALVPVHKMCPMAHRVHTEKWKTVYFLLAADYLCTFLPKDPNEIILPQNIGGSIKVAQSIQISPIKPSRSPVYLQLSALTRHSPNPITSNRGMEPSWTESGGRSDHFHAWRTESVLYLFIDSWLRFNVDDNRDLPSSEFIRLIRILVKQGHFFANSADIDNTSMSQLRKLAQAMIQAQIFSFISGIISRWPLDCSFMVVLELWLSYIQPWRYVFGRVITENSDYNGDLLRFESFIQDNLCEYTQIFIQLLPRFECLDLTSLKNVLMIYRLVKVFSQPNLLDVLSRFERSVEANSNGFMQLKYHSPSQFFPPTKPSNAFHETNYQYMFHPTVREKIENLLRKIKQAELIARENNRSNSIQLPEDTFAMIWERIVSFFVDNNDCLENVTQQEQQKIPDVLQNTAQLMANAFNLEIPEISAEDVESYQRMSTSISDSTNDSHQLSFSRMNNSKSRIFDYHGDPDLLPIRSNEYRAVFREKYLGPRVSLRPLASYKTFFFVGTAMILGQFCFNSFFIGISYLNFPVWYSYHVKNWFSGTTQILKLVSLQDLSKEFTHLFNSNLLTNARSRSKSKR
uniref:Sphingomyelin phosphodiesterase 4 n=2 Tax=Lutzomyia longipalpis TaxID=7200 RepID=A0A1B0CLM3_LUTLO